MINYQAYKAAIAKISNKQKYIILGSLLACSSIALSVVVLEKHQRRAESVRTQQPIKQAKYGQEIEIKLANMSSQLNTIQKNLSTKSAYVDLNRANESLEVLQRDLKDLKQSTQSIVAKEVEKSNKELAMEIKNLSSKLDAEKPEVVKASDLPFTIISLDTIESQPVVTVYYDYRRTPLEAGDSIAGWVLEHSDTLKQQIEFSKGKKKVIYHVKG